MLDRWRVDPEVREGVVEYQLLWDAHSAVARRAAMTWVSTWLHTPPSKALFTVRRFQSTPSNALPGVIGQCICVAQQSQLPAYVRGRVPFFSSLGFAHQC